MLFKIVFRDKMQEVIKQWQMKTLKMQDDAQVLRIRRNHIWPDALRGISKPTFDRVAPISIWFLGEEAADAGGPHHEFLCLLYVH